MVSSVRGARSTRQCRERDYAGCCAVKKDAMNFKDAFDVELKSGQSLIARLDTTGDTKIFWDHQNQTEIDIARAAFTKAKADGYMAYKVTGKDGAKGEILAQFDPLAERIILAPPLRGG
jgi:hypothetical protein